MRQKLISSCLILTFILSAALFVQAQGDAKKAKVLVFTRSQGFEHGPAKLQEDGTTICGQALKAYFDSKNVEVVDTQDGKLFDGDLDQYAGFVFYTSGNLEEEKGSRNDKAFALSADGLKKLFAAVKAGKGFVGIHSGCDTHCKQKNADGLDLYTEFVGARFVSHGPMQDATVTVVQPCQLPCFKDKGDKVTMFEEWYAMKTFNKDMHVILVQETEGMKGDCYRRPPFPSTWIRADEKGRVAYTAFGHDNKFWIKDKVVQLDNVKIVGELIEWSIGRFDMDTTPNFEKVTPNGNELSPPAPPKPAPAAQAPAPANIPAAKAP